MRYFSLTADKQNRRLIDILKYICLCFIRLINVLLKFTFSAVLICKLFL